MPRVPALCFAIVAVLSLPPGVRAELGPIRPEFEVSHSGVYSYYGYVYPDAHNEAFGSTDIAASASGTFVVVWDDLYAYGPGYYSYSIPGAWARRFDKLGRPLGPEFRVGGFNTYAKGGVAVASDPAGRFVVVWDDYRADQYGDYENAIGILGRRYDAGGAAQGGVFLVNEPALGPDRKLTPKAAADGTGNFMVVWAEPDDYYDGPRIAGRRFSSAGTPLGASFQVNSSGTCDCSCNCSYCCAYSGFEGFATFDDMDVAGDSSGNFMVVWRGPADPYSPIRELDVKGRIFDSTGTPSGPEFTVNTYTTGDQSGPSLASDNNGNFVVVWTEYFGYDISGRRFDSTGSALGADFQVNTTPIYSFSYGPSVAADATGRFVVTWDAQGRDYAIYAREFDAAGTPVGAQFRVDQLTDDYGEAGIRRQNVAASAAGDFVVAWGQYRFDEYTYGADGRVLGPAPVPCTPAPKLGCKAQTVARGGVFRFVRKAASSRRNVMVWRWVRGQETTVADLGDPFATHSYAVCVYDASARAQPLIDLAVPAGGACGRIPCWRELSGQRIDYFDKARFVGGIELLRVTPKPEGRARVIVRARKENLALPTTPLTPPVTVQLQAANDTCWTAHYASFVIKNAYGVFKARGEP